MQSLQYLLKLCSHPLPVTGENPPDHLVDLLKEIGVGSGGELHELHHSPKLVALQEILQECGIGSEISSPDASTAIGQHRVLIFAQHKVWNLSKLWMTILFFQAFRCHPFRKILVSWFNCLFSGFSWHYWEGPISISYEKVSYMMCIDLAVWCVLHAFFLCPYCLCAFKLHYIAVPLQNCLIAEADLVASNIPWLIWQLCCARTLYFLTNSWFWEHGLCLWFFFC